MLFNIFQKLIDLRKKHDETRDEHGEVGKQIRLRSDNVVESFMISLKLAFYVGMIFSLPFILYFIAEFVLPALTKREKRLLAPGFSLGLIFFLAGAAASYLYIMPDMLAFFY